MPLLSADTQGGFLPEEDANTAEDPESEPRVVVDEPGLCLNLQSALIHERQISRSQKTQARLFTNDVRTAVETFCLQFWKNNLAFSSATTAGDSLA